MANRDNIKLTKFHIRVFKSYLDSLGEKTTCNICNSENSFEMGEYFALMQIPVYDRHSDSFSSNSGYGAPAFPLYCQKCGKIELISYNWVMQMAD